VSDRPITPPPDEPGNPTDPAEHARMERLLRSLRRGLGPTDDTEMAVLIWLAATLDTRAADALLAMLRRAIGHSYDAGFTEGRDGR
jgi:hypothetical protein